MAAKVVFSDGSKAMAHNLDDLYERWLVRHQEIAEADPYADTLAELEMFVPKLPPLETREQAAELRLDLLAKLDFVQRKVQEFDMRSRVTPFETKFHRVPTLSAKVRIQNQLAQIKAYLKIQNQQGAHSVAQVSARIKELSEQKDTEGLSLQEQIEIAELRFDQAQRQLEGLRRAADKVESDERIERLEDLVNHQRKTLINVQTKLLAAYEHIIELQGGESNDAE